MTVSTLIDLCDPELEAAFYECVDIDDDADEAYDDYIQFNGE